MKSIEIISLKRVAITKNDLLLLDKWDYYVTNYCSNIEPEQDGDNEYLFLEEITAHHLGLITYAEFLDMSDYNSRITLQGVKKYHWKELKNTESDNGTWDITFDIDQESSDIKDLQQRIEVIKEKKNLIAKSQRYEDAAMLRDTEKQLMLQLEKCKSKIHINLYDGDDYVGLFKVNDEQFEELIDLIKRIS